jgi:cysteinyl-tRNA synthetase
VDGEKMSKSLGNLFTLSDILQRGYTATSLRYALLSGHYRQPLNFTIASLHASQQALKRLSHFDKSLRDLVDTSIPMADEFHLLSSPWHMLCDDLNTPAALGRLFDAVHAYEGKNLPQKETIRLWREWQRLLFAFGLENAWGNEAIPEEIESLAQERLMARQKRDFARADELREVLAAQGWTVEDSVDSYVLHRTASKV